MAKKINLPGPDADGINKSPGEKGDLPKVPIDKINKVGDLPKVPTQQINKDGAFTKIPTTKISNEFVSLKYSFILILLSKWSFQNSKCT